MTTKAINENVEFVEEGEYVFYIDVGGETAVLPKRELSDYCVKQLRKVCGGSA